MNKPLKIFAILAVGFMGGLFLKDRIFGVGLPAPIHSLSLPTEGEPHLEMRLRGLTASKAEKFVFLIDEPGNDEYVAFPKAIEEGVLRIEVLRK
jgi:hypothetical protein